MNLYKILLVGAGGFIGSIARYLTVITIDKRLNSVFPYGTMTVNLLGAFLLGFLLAMVTKKTGMHAHEWKLFLGTGFCGGFTTFSAFAVENVNLWEQKLPGTAILYMTISMAGGILAVWVGIILGRNIV
jgi:CrcB protein